jgi:arylformamidase
MKISQVIDLSHPLRPGHEPRRLEINRLDAPEITGAADETDWYIMHYINMDNHIGTHLEVAYHCFEDGDHLGQIPAGKFVSEAVILDLRGYQASDPIPLEAVQQAARQAGGIKNGDSVFCMTGWSSYYGTEAYFKPPYLSVEALKWILNFGIKLLGLDTTGAMDPNVPDRLNHLPIFEAGTVYIENLTNLDHIPGSRAVVAALPPAIEGLEGFPIRVIAMI